MTRQDDIEAENRHNDERHMLWFFIGVMGVLLFCWLAQRYQWDINWPQLFKGCQQSIQRLYSS